ncbi:DUF4105 domain-containing protein [Enterobacter asburiae]|uniref:Lnb N-terminal periplasmic domain-containing protein n=1 Tax=Scandinavium sp. UTDF21-P1B TaxID=3446379 RepID=UPI00347722D0
MSSGNAQQANQPNDWLLEYSRLAAIIWYDQDRFHIKNVRNFRYRDPDNYLPDWYHADYRISEVVATDLVLSYWSGKAIAHVFLSFGFSDGRWLAISIETRRRQGQHYSAFGGFFRRYPVIYILADERDLIGVRTDIRREDVYLYPLNISVEHSQTLLRDYLRRVKQVNEHPEHYHTLCNNCTTNILLHGKAVSSAVKYNWKILLSGYADLYCYQHGLISDVVPFNQLKRSCYLARPENASIGDDFSHSIRKHRP